MTNQHRQEGLSRAYVQAIASRGGYMVSVPSPDYGIDVSFRRVQAIKGRYVPTGVSLDAQLKCTMRAAVGASAVDYDLDVAAYNKLRLSQRIAPQILILLVLPSDPEEWVAQDEDALQLRKCAYWMSFRGAGATRNASTVRVQVPRRNQFTVAELDRIVALAGAGRDIR